MRTLILIQNCSVLNKAIYEWLMEKKILACTGKIPQEIEKVKWCLLNLSPHKYYNEKAVMNYCSVI